MYIDVYFQQYSALLVQYKTDGFGGFKKNEVYKEINRGRKLVYNLDTLMLKSCFFEQWNPIKSI